MLKQLSSVERAVVTGYQPFEKVAQLKEGLSGRGQPVKTLNILSSQAEGRGVSHILGSVAVPAVPAPGPGHGEPKVALSLPNVALSLPKVALF